MRLEAMASSVSVRTCDLAFVVKGSMHDCSACYAGRDKAHKKCYSARVRCYSATTALLQTNMNGFNAVGI